MRGGKREGSGRPAGSKIDDSLRRERCGMFRLPAWVIKRLQKTYGATASRRIEGFILDATGWKEVEIKELTAAEYAEKTGCSIQKIRDMAKEGMIAGAFKRHGVWIFPVKERL